MQADGVLEYIVDHTVGVDVTAISLASRYDLSGKLGEGAFSQVWRGQRLGGGDACALKCIDLESLDDDDEALEMLATEVAALRAAALGLGAEQRRHVLGLREVVRTAEEVCLVVDLVAGSELFELIERHGPLPDPMVRHLVRQLLGALAALHGHATQASNPGRAGRVPGRSAAHTFGPRPEQAGYLPSRHQV